MKNRPTSDEVRSNQYRARKCFDQAARAMNVARAYKSVGYIDAMKNCLILARSFHRSGRHHRKIARMIQHARRALNVAAPEAR